MKKLSMTKAWEESAAFVKRDAGLLLLISFGLIALPSVIFQAASPQPAPGEVPEGGPWMLLFLPLILLSLLGSLTISVLATGAESDARDAFSRALRRLLSVLGAVFLLGIGATLLALPFIIVMTLLVQSVATLSFIVALAFVAAFAFLWVRFMLMVPAASAESGGPVAILKRSWRLTSGNTARLLGFIVIVVIVSIVLMFAITALGGTIILLVAGQPQEGNLSSVLIALLGGIISAVLSLFLTALVARIYVQLAEDPISGI